MATKSRTGSDVDLVEFRKAMASFASGVNIITVADPDGTPHGMTATAFCSVSVEPPLVLICVSRDTRTHDMIIASDRFGVSMLSSDATEISDYCARPGGDKRLADSWLRLDARSSTPALTAALVHVDCRVHERLDVGTHSIFVGNVENLDFGDGSNAPLLYFQGNYGALVAET